jgi:hypothetical protein
MEGSVSRITAYQGLQLVKDYNLSVDGAAITLQKMGWIICRYIRGNIRGKSVSPTDTCIRGYKDQNFVSTDISFTDTDTNGYGFIHILAFAYVHSNQLHVEHHIKHDTKRNLHAELSMSLSYQTAE